MLISQTAATAEQWSTSWSSVVGYSIGLALVMGLILWVYRSMQRPRLYLQYRDADQRPVVTWQAVIRYLVTTSISLFIWMMAIILILTVAAEDRTAEQIVLAATAVIGGSRVLAHVSPEGAHELGKTIPLAVVSIILLGGSPNASSLVELGNEMDANAGVLDFYYVALLLFDFVLTTLWTIRQFGKWDTNQAGTWRHRVRARFRRMMSPWHAVRDFGKPPKTQPSSEVSHGH